MLQPVVLAGGSGSRLWPLSREHYPKQFIPLLAGNSLLQQTVLRLDSLNANKPLFVCNEAHRFLLAEQMQAINIKPEAIILEPCGRNTAPAIAIAALQALSSDKDSVLLVLPADHLVQESLEFCETVTKAMSLAKDDLLVTFGVKPSSPHTGYGYIHKGEALGELACKVDRFVEKPDLATAEQYLKSGEYLWNSGMFLFKASSYIAALEQYAPEILTACQQALKQSQTDLDFIRLDKTAFSACPSDSIDYAVMEKTDQAVVVPLLSDWSDIGSWGALSAVGNKNTDNNVVLGDVICEDTHNCYLRSEDKLLSAVGVKDLIVVASKDAILVADKHNTEAVKNIVNTLKDRGRSEAKHHVTEYRPWGQHEIIAAGSSFEVRQVTVKPGATISLQRHHKRSEHWVVVQGIASVTVGDKSMEVKNNQSFYVPIGKAHKVSNKGAELLKFIEVQVGECLKEDDIERINT